MLFVFVYGKAESMHNFYKHLNRLNFETPLGHKMIRGYKKGCMTLVINKIFQSITKQLVECSATFPNVYLSVNASDRDGPTQ